MRNEVRLDGWTISAEHAGLADPFLESVFFTGNGRMGARGYAALRRELRPVDVGFFVAGVFDEIKPGVGITDFVNLPTPLWQTVELEGLEGVPASPVRRELDLRSGALTISYCLAAGGRRVEVTERRFYPLNRPDLLVQRLVLTADSGAALTVRSGIENRCCNSPVPDDQVKQNNEIVQLTLYQGKTVDGSTMTANYTTARTKIKICQSVSFHSEGFSTPTFFEDSDTVGAAFHAHPSAGVTVVLDKLTHIATSRDVDPRLNVLPKHWTYQELWEENLRAWTDKWDDCEIRLEGDVDTQTALRYTVYQLIVNCSPRDDTVNIGARGLTHTRYKGCYFWDTDLFMMPFYLLTDPEAARSLMGYRVNTLTQAKSHAIKMGGMGARYPWMVSYDGTEQCESWDIGCSEVHVTADVAYAAGQYMDWTADRDFFLRGGAALLIETARFWVSRYSPAPDGGVNLLFCKGPDEYCGITNNNLFTNMMVRHNLDMAATAADELRRADPEQYRALLPDEYELAAWAKLRDAIKLPRDPETGRWRTDDTFHLLERVDLKTVKKDDEASYHDVCFDRLQRYQVVKQADVLLLMSRLRENFTERERLDAWADFEPLCLHDSTLSFASHALFAAQNGLVDVAEAYFNKAVYLDLKEIMGNTGKEGLHLACLGETWQAVVFGFAGLHFKDGIPELTPHLPHNWTRLCFRFQYRGRHYKVEVSPSSAAIEWEEDVVN